MNEKKQPTATHFLTSHPEIRELKKHYHELTGEYLSGWNWDEFSDLNSYLTYLHRKVAEAEAAEKEKTE